MVQEAGLEMRDQSGQNTKHDVHVDQCWSSERGTGHFAADPEVRLTSAGLGSDGGEGVQENPPEPAGDSAFPLACPELCPQLCPELCRVQPGSWSQLTGSFRLF